MFRPAIPQRLAAAALLACTAAGAQSISIAGTYERLATVEPKALATYRTASKHPDWISYLDCASNVKLRFPLALANVPASGSATLRVWAGTDDCKTLANRSGDSTRTCWPVSADLDQIQGREVPVIVSTQHIAGYIAKTAADKPKEFSALPTETTPSLCDSATNGLTSTGPTAVKLWFMFTDGSGNVVGTPLEWATSVDLNGPSAPASVSLTSGDSAINVSLTVSDSTSDTSSEYVVYCYDVRASSATPADAGAPTPGDSGGSTSSDASADGSPDASSDAGDTADAGASSDAGAPADAGEAADADGGADGGEAAEAGAAASTDSGVSAACSAPWIPEPTSPLSAAFLKSIGAFECGRIGGTSRSSRVTSYSSTGTRLQNGVTYAVAVVGSDSVDNVGGIKSGGCVQPVDTTTFWDSYENAGGDAGGCSIGRVPLSGPSVAFCALVGLAAALRLRRKGR